MFFGNIKMNAITGRFFLAGGKFMLEMHSRQSGFNYSACWLYTKKHKKNNKSSKKQETR